MAKIKKTAVGVKGRIKDDRLSLVAAGVAFYAFLSLFPALATVISIYGLLADAQTVQSHVERLGGIVPDEVLAVISSRMEDLATTPDSSLTFGFVFGIIISLWSANKAMKAVSAALNIAYDMEEDRGFLKVNAVTLLLTLTSAIVFIVAIAVIVIVPALVSTFLSHQAAATFTTLTSWVIFILLLVGMFLVLYRFAPARKRRQAWRNLLPGAALATGLFVIASLAFSFYVSNYGEYDAQYGALGAVVVLMLWLFIGAFIFLLGAEVNAECNQPEVRRAAQR
ncbi:YihY/virulence factor BrkB family protein [Microbulbifer rhizosphaerae]|uniref:Membrane protein n=1 Tax=Microbulbifer rhizosphaerae TaxID=1562603 RepID=A0A7W4WFQ7_9GAMM|nr:YihY/virulence factor BrkB family protein [Microbulbifer rhizosphaerae]MBB3063394.1 membrane protein [Microbulbifer rhizosphaerae]